jgi:hypothetical protein
MAAHLRRLLKVTGLDTSNSSKQNGISATDVSMVMFGLIAVHVVCLSICAEATRQRKELLVDTREECYKVQVLT